MVVGNEYILHYPTARKYPGTSASTSASSHPVVTRPSSGHRHGERRWIAQTTAEYHMLFLIFILDTRGY